jgi:CheY-like chemotaxis protein
MTPDPCRNTRILIVDDNEDIHHDFHRILTPRSSTPEHGELDEMEAQLLGTAAASFKSPAFELTSAFQGAEALAKVQQSLETQAPYALAFVDVRMPPGWDGIETLTRIWQEDPALQAVLCSAYADYSWEHITARFGQTDRLLILKKPFDPVEVRQMACALAGKWNNLRANQQADQALRRSEARLRGLLQALPDAILRVSPDGTCLDFKASRTGASSLQPAFPPGGPLAAALPPDVAQRVLDYVGQALRHGTTHAVVYEHWLGSQARCFEARIAAIDATEALVLLRDITEQKPTPSAAINPGQST